MGISPFKSRFAAQLFQKGRRNYFTAYTVLFAAASLLVFSWYFMEGRTFIWKSDGWTQHYKALICYSRYLRSFARELLINHRFVLPEWDFSIGEGSDILGTLHYYVIGDPFALLSVFVPVRFMYLYYDIMILMRLYLAGIAFSCLCFKTGKRKGSAVMAGSLVYVFCYWAIYNAARHPYFLNPMIYLPFIILGIEKILKKEKPYLFIAAVFLSAVSNFYFFYMLVLITVIYAFVRTAFCFGLKKWKEWLFTLLQIGASSILGVLMAAVIFLPMCYVFLHDARMSARNAVPLLYPAAYYARLLPMFMNTGHPYWMCMGYAAPTLPAVLLLFIKKKNSLLKVLFILCAATACIPFFGHVLNGFSYVANRWCFAFALLSAYIMAAMWPHLMALTKKESILLTAGMISYTLICLIPKQTRTDSMYTELIIAYLFLLSVIMLQHIHHSRLNRWKTYAALLFVLASISNISFWKNSAHGDNYASQSKKAEDLSGELTGNETEAVRYAADLEDIHTFYRYTGDRLSINAGVLAGISSTQYYWTLSNPYVFEARSTLGLREVSAYRYLGYDDRSALAAMAAVRYYVLPSGNPPHLPYGFTKKEPARPVSSKQHASEFPSQKDEDSARATASSKYTVYQNSYALPVAYTYESYLSDTHWRQLSDIEKQEAMLQKLVLDKDSYKGPLNESYPLLTSKKIGYTIKRKDKNVSIQSNAFIVKKAHSTITLKFKGLSESETYLCLHGMHFQGKKLIKQAQYKDNISDEAAQACLSLRSSTGVQKKLTYYTENHRAYDNRHDFSVNLCYADDAVTSVRIAFSKAGTYSFDSLSIVCQPMRYFANEIKERKKVPLDNITVGTNEVKATVSLKKPELLCLAIPYSAGWQAYVDGQKTPLYRANIMYMALDVGNGRHSVRLEYHTPLLREGIFISLITFLLFGIWLYFSHKNYRIQKEITK